MRSSKRPSSHTPDRELYIFHGVGKEWTRTSFIKIYVVLSGSIWVLHHLDSIVMPLPLPFGRSLSHLSKLLKHQLGLTDTVHLQITGKAWPSQLISNSPTASCHLIFSEYCSPNNKSTPWWWKNMGTSWKITSFKTWMTYNHPSSIICNSLVPAWCQPGFMPSPASMTNIPASMLQCGFWSFHSLTTLECRTSTTTRPVMKQQVEVLTPAKRANR